MNVLSVALPIGQFRILLDNQHAPATCTYFADLVHAGGLNDATVFRVLSEANQDAEDARQISVVQVGMAQGLDAPRTQILHEDTQRTGLRHDRWTVSAARFKPGELYGSFFVCMRDEPALDHGGSRHPDGQGFAAFGRVISGFDTLAQLHARAEHSDLLAQHIDIDEVIISKVSPRQLERWRAKNQ